MKYCGNPQCGSPLPLGIGKYCRACQHMQVRGAVLVIVPIVIVAVIIGLIRNL